jgi:MFS transporter, MHS family, alpha-ketoglutarate permease
MDKPTTVAHRVGQAAQGVPIKPVSKARTLIGTGIGNAVEWYDWTIYAIFAPFFAGQLFNNENPASAVLATLAIFAVGFLARPVGGFIFGWLGDRRGRKFSMTLAIALSSLGCLMIALVPTYAAVGMLASVILLAARLIQGLAHGGELPSSQTYLSEMAPPEKRGFWATLIYTSGTIGVLFGTALGAVLTVVLSTESMHAWGWRVPFIIGAAMGLYALYMRTQLRETEAFVHESTAEKRAPIWPQIVRHRKQAFQVIGITAGGTVAYYTWAVSAPGYAATILGMDPGATLWSGVIGNLVFLAALPLWGKASDKFGRKPILWTSSIGVAVLHFPMTWLMKDSPWQLTVSMSVMLLFMAGFAAILPAVYSELFPTSIRTIGLAVPYSVNAAVFGGTAPYLNSWLTSITGGPTAFGLYLIALLLIACMVYFTIPETKGKVLH